MCPALRSNLSLLLDRCVSPSGVSSPIIRWDTFVPAFCKRSRGKEYQGAPLVSRRLIQSVLFELGKAPGYCFQAGPQFARERFALRVTATVFAIEVIEQSDKYELSAK